MWHGGLDAQAAACHLAAVVVVVERLGETRHAREAAEQTLGRVGAVGPAEPRLRRRRPHAHLGVVRVIALALGLGFGSGLGLG